MNSNDELIKQHHSRWQFLQTLGQEVNRWPAVAAVENSGFPAAAAVKLSGWPAAAAENQRSSREAQLSPDAFEPIPSEEVQDHFSPGKKNLFYTDIF